MQPQPPPYDPRMLDAFVALLGTRRWTARMAEIAGRTAAGPRSGQFLRQRYALELAIERLRGALARPPSAAELHAAKLAGDAVGLWRRLGTRGKAALKHRLNAALVADGTLVPVFHMLRTAALQASRGFLVAYPGLEQGTPYDLVISSGALEAEISCEVVSAEEGRLVHRSAWSQLVDRVDGHLRSWLRACPGQYLLKMTLPCGLAIGSLAETHGRIVQLLEAGVRHSHHEAAVLRLDPLVFTDRKGEQDLVPALRRQFGPEAHLAVTATANGLCAMAARSGRADEIAVAVRRHLFDAIPGRLSGTRPGILALFVEDTDRNEWRGLCDRLELEGEARHFLACRAARIVIAVTCASRVELFGLAEAAEGGELRFRNPAHPAATQIALAPAILSSV